MLTRYNGYTMKIEIWSDVMCPFCYLGKKHLEEALAIWGGEAEVEWKSYQLNPGLGTTPVSTLSYLSEAKGLSREALAGSFSSLEAAGTAKGIRLDFENAKIVNTLSAHRFIQLAKTEGKGDAAEELLFEAHFSKGENVADLEVLEGIAQRLEIEDAARAQKDPQYVQAVQTDVLEAQAIGVRGVPFFVVDGKYGISGAQPVEVFVDTFKKASE